jgi:hypothetical protein|nr:MAG TPA: hypothetical protein [Caudoviricetes sp.]
MSINFIFGLILAMVIGTIISYLATQGADFLIRYIRKRNHCEKNIYLKDWHIVDFDPDVPTVQINAKEFTDDEVMLDARDWCKEDDRIVFIMVKTADKANLVTKNGVRDVTDIYNKFHKEKNNEPEDEDTDRNDDRDDVDSADEDHQ